MNDENRKLSDAETQQSAPGRSRKRSGSGFGKILPVAAGFFGVLAAAGIVYYVVAAQGYKSHFLPGTMIGGVDVSGRSVEEVKEAFSREATQYVLTIEEREEKTEQISGSEIALATEFDGTLEEILAAQNPYSWIFHLGKTTQYQMQTALTWDEDALDARIGALSAMDTDVMRAPVDAHLSEYIAGTGFEIVPEDPGTTLDPQAVQMAIRQAIESLTPMLSLEEAGCYIAPQVLSDDATLLAERDKKNELVNVTVTYEFGNQKEVLSGETISGWLTGSGENVTLSDSEVANYVAALAKKYDTAYTTREFPTSYGKTVKVSGVYGWRINRSEEAAQLKAMVLAGQSGTREPVYSQKGASRGAKDYGDTYAEVNLTAQHLFFYKDGKKILESDFVSGNVAKGYTTPAGFFSLTYKQRDAVLKGEGYASPVKFWMPFNGGIGFHDASWRSSFGGTIYKKGGSHGCVNMPYAAAKTLFENVYAGMPVICYNLAGTESSTPTKASGKPDTSETTAPAATTAPATQSAQTQPATTAAPTTAAPTTAAPAPTTAAPTEVSTAPAQTVPNGPGSTTAQPTQQPNGPGTTETSVQITPVEG